MVELQHKFNEQTIENYLDKNLNWNSAIIAESGELLDSLGYKWWKKQTPDMENVKVEAIDLLHFVISESMQYYFKDTTFCVIKAIEDFKNYFEEIYIYDNFNETNIEKLISHLNYDQYDRFFIMKQIFKALNMSNEDVYIAYVVKNCLNKFRQDNGYKDGSYIKDWNTREDNAVAYDIAKELAINENLFEQLYFNLTAYYNEKVKNQIETKYEDNLDYFNTQKVN